MFSHFLVFLKSNFGTMSLSLIKQSIISIDSFPHFPIIGEMKKWLYIFFIFFFYDWTVPCDTSVGDRCLPQDWSCTLANSGACPAGNKCCARPSFTCDCRNSQSCLLPQECLSARGTILGDYACYAAPTNNYVCCQEPGQEISLFLFLWG